MLEPFEERISEVEDRSEGNTQHERQKDGKLGGNVENERNVLRESNVHNRSLRRRDGMGQKPCWKRVWLRTFKPRK